MLHLDVTLEDTRIIAAVDDNSEWVGTIHDAHSGQSQAIKWSHTQMGAVLALGIGGDESFTKRTTTELYEVAEDAIKELTPELRPIP